MRHEHVVPPETYLVPGNAVAVEREIGEIFSSTRGIVCVTELEPRLPGVAPEGIQNELDHLVADGRLIEWFNPGTTLRGWTPAPFLTQRIAEQRQEGWRIAASLTPEDVEDVLLDGDSHGMSEFLEDVLKKEARFDEISYEWTGDYDLTAHDRENNRHLFIEAKRVPVLGANRIPELLEANGRLRAKNPDAEYVVVTAGVFTSEAKNALAAAGITAWDRETLLKLADPAIIEGYRAARRRQARHGSDPGPRLLSALETMPAGKTHWSEYQNLIKKILEYLFAPPLGVPRYERKTGTGADRRDVIFANPAPTGAWSLFRQLYKADYVVVDAKNYKEPLDKTPIISVAHYLKWYGVGLFALIASRKGVSRGGEHALNEQWIGSKRMIVVLTDDDFVEMIRLKQEGVDPVEVISQRIERFRLDL